MSNKSISTFSKKLMDDAGVGLGTIDTQELIIPRLSIVQALSAVTKPSSDKYIREARIGNIVLDATQDVFEGDIGVSVLIAHYRKAFIEWQPAGQGFVRDHGNNPSVLSEAVRDENYRNILPSGNEIKETAEYAVILLNNKIPVRAIITMASSQLKIARRLNSVINAWSVEIEGKVIQPPLFAREYIFKAKEVTKGTNSWYVWQVSVGRQLESKDEAVYESAKQLNSYLDSSAPKQVESEDIIEGF